MNSIRLGSLGIALALLGNQSAMAGEPRQEFYSGRYQAELMDRDDYLDFPVRLGVDAFLPNLPGNLAGITEQIVFECRPDGSLTSVGGYPQFSDYLRNALIDQLSAIEVYAEHAPVRLTGTLRKIDLFLDQIVGESAVSGTWSISLELRSSLGETRVFSIQHSHPLSARNVFCEEMAGSFMASVQSLVSNALGSNAFRALLVPTPES